MTLGDDRKRGTRWHQPLCPCTGVLVAGVSTEGFAHWHPITPGSNKSRDPSALDGRLPFLEGSWGGGAHAFIFPSLEMKQGPFALCSNISLASVCLALEFTSVQSKHQSPALRNTSNFLTNVVGHCSGRGSWLRVLLTLNLKNIGLILALLPSQKGSAELVLKIMHTMIMDSGSFTTRPVSRLFWINNYLSPIWCGRKEEYRDKKRFWVGRRRVLLGFFVLLSKMIILNHTMKPALLPHLFKVGLPGKRLSYPLALPFMRKAYTDKCKLN